MRRFTKHIPSSLALDLRNLRLERGLDQAQVAQEIANLAGVPELLTTWWAQIETGARTIPLSKLLAVGKFFYPNEVRSFLRRALYEQYPELAETLFSEGGEERPPFTIRFTGEDAEKMRKFYSLPQSSRDVLYNLFDNMLKSISTTKTKEEEVSSG